MARTTHAGMIAALLAVCWVAPLHAADSRPAIRDLQIRRSDSQIRVSFQLVEAFDDEVRQRIESGLPTGFVFEAKLEKKRRWWFNDAVLRSRIEAVAMYNAVTREYLVNTKQDGRLIDSRVFTSLGDAQKAMSRVHDIAVFHLDALPRGRLTVLVRAELGSRTLLSLFPTTVHTNWAESEPFRLVAGRDDES
ncbi:MAG TPA: DUF4390 domain-containing protein [Thermoanaerobaculia bacterium]|nr:DUF4390 domain-containing protein [Thermoanaerobaculia bacterium]